MIPRQTVVVAGGIGSGKSQVVGLISGLGWSVLNADDLGHEALSQPAVIDAVGRRWPAAVVGGKVSRPALASVVFSEPAELAILESLTHPFVAHRIDNWFEGAPRPAAVEVSVLKLVRPDWGPVVIVHAPMEIRKKRAVERGMTIEDVDSRIAAQPTDSELLARADIVIDNQGTIEDLTEVSRCFDRWARTS